MSQRLILLVKILLRLERVSFPLSTDRARWNQSETEETSSRINEEKLRWSWWSFFFFFSHSLQLQADCLGLSKGLLIKTRRAASVFLIDSYLVRWIQDESFKLMFNICTLWTRALRKNGVDVIISELCKLLIWDETSLTWFIRIRREA